MEEMYCTQCHGRGLDAHDHQCEHCQGTGYEPDRYELTEDRQ